MAADSPVVGMAAAALLGPWAAGTLAGRSVTEWLYTLLCPGT
ncbi:MAG TPA: hypothetical protein VKE24_08200 [Candidatus Acidoferrales bacterium]|nr:hypothetical protein [Candidatus Acidoferrales bacterium]